MIEIVKSDEFENWIRKLRDMQARARITRLSMGNPGDVKSAGHGLSEMRIDYGPGYRVYFRQKGDMLVIILCGGDKSTQQADIEKAAKIFEEWST